ncbi:MAG: IS110 family transposase [Candidatus Methanomethylophilaceae archaeon]|jgi:transposase
MKIAIGIDVHKEKCAAFAVFAGLGDPRPRHTAFLEKFNEDFRRFPSDYAGMTALFERVRDHDAEVLIENSTKSHDIYWMLTNLGLKVTVAHATDLYRITMSKTKNDDNDARELAGYMRRRIMGENEFHESHIPSLETLKLREICRFTLNDREELSALKRQIRSHLLIRGWKLTREYKDITSASALREIRAYRDPVLLLDSAKAESLKKRIRETEKVMRYMMRDDPVFDVIWSVTGFGILSATYLTCMIDDISRFGSGRSFSASMGLTPRLYESADKPKNCGISRRGDPALRKLMCQATFVHVFRTDSPIAEKYRRLTSEGKHHNEAIVACANSMGRMIWKMVRDGRRYESGSEELAAARLEADSEDVFERMKEFVSH